MNPNIKHIKLHVLHQPLHQEQTTRLFLRILWVLLQPQAPIPSEIYRQPINLHLNTPLTIKILLCVDWHLFWARRISRLTIKPQYKPGDTSAQGYTSQSGILPKLLPQPPNNSLQKPSHANALNLHPNAQSLYALGKLHTLAYFCQSAFSK